MVATIDVRYTGSSTFLAASMPVEVLDAGNVVVRRRAGAGAITVPAGVYVIRAFDLDGSVVEVEVDLDEGDQYPMHLGYSDGPGPLRETTVASQPSVSLPNILGTPPGDGSAGPVTHLHTAGCVAQEVAGGWVFQAISTPQVTPYASFRLGKKTTTVSLPVNPGPGFPTNACVAVPVSTPAGDTIVVRFPMQRAVATVVDGMLNHDAVLHGMNMLGTATQLLYDKYSDAPAAALGALTLHRLGHLGDRQGWVDNLSRDFPWIPDGRILRAAVLARSGDAKIRRSGLDALLSTAAERPMFTDGHALQLQLLRRWPRDTARKRRADVLEQVLGTRHSVDWSGVVLTTTTEG